MLATITVRKATAELRQHYAKKRGSGVVRGESVFGGRPQQADFGINDVLAAGNLSAMSEQLTATCTEMLEELPDDSLRTIARLRLEGYSSEDIGEQLGVSLATVKRRLSKIRQVWS